MASRKKSPARRRAPKDEQEQPRPSFLGWLFRTLVLAAIWGGVIAAFVVAYYAADMPDIKQVAQAQRRPSVTLLADDGSVLAHYGDLYGHYVTLGDVPPNLVHAIIAIEDRRFYSHFGIDVLGVLRAGVRNVAAGHMVQGGSTLTQQLAKNLFLSPERTLRRKVQEMLLALWLEHTYTKDQILTAYLNRVYLGAGTYGVDAASEVYFDKPVSAITLRESAILAGLLRAPSRFSPAHDMGQAMDRAETVLGTMVEAGYITEVEKNAALTEAPVPRRKPGAGGDGRYFADWVTDQTGSLLGNTPKDLVIATTLDVRLQRAAERHLDAVLAASGDKNVSQGAVVTLAPDGGVRALVGGRDYNASQFNRATQAMRQPGSSFKPIIYLAALEHGLSPSDVFVDEPINLGDWSPQNYDGKYRGRITAREALAESVNTVAVRVLQKAGVGNAIETARALGVTSPLEHELSLALGTNTLTPLELTGVYAGLASGGRMVTPYAIKEIRNREGQVLYHRQEVTAPVTVDPKAVATLVDMMQDVVKYGTGKRAALGRPVAGKTGTSSDYRDAWFMGFTGNYVTGVWLGNDDNSPMKRVTGGSLPAEVWHDYMVEAEAGVPERGLLGETASAPQGPTTADGIGDFIRGLMGADKR